MKCLPLALLASLLFAVPSTAQPGQKQANNCVATFQGKIEDSDSRMNETNAPYDLITFRAQRGEELYLRLESTAFAPQLALFKVTEDGYEFIESDRSPYDDRSELFPWIYEDATYAVRVVPNMLRTPLEPIYTDAQWPQRGYYTLQISPFACS